MPSTSVRPRSSCLRKPCRMPRLSFGTARWACSRSTRLRAALLSIAHAIADAYALTIVGGGETAMAIHRAGESEEHFLHFHRRRRGTRTTGRQTAARLVALPERND